MLQLLKAVYINFYSSKSQLSFNKICEFHL